MDSYTNIIGQTSFALMSSMIWGVAFFVVLFVPLYVYIKHFMSSDNQQKTISVSETIAFALLLQIGTLFAFAIIGVFIEKINIGNNGLKPSKSYELFFGNGNELIDERWGSYLKSLETDSTALTALGAESKGTAFLANKYIGILYKLFIILLFYIVIFSIFNSFYKSFQDRENNPNMFGRLYSFFAKGVFFTLLIIIHSLIAAELPSFFGINRDSVGINFIPYFQAVISSILYEK